MNSFWQLISYFLVSQLKSFDPESQCTDHKCGCQWKTFSANVWGKTSNDKKENLCAFSCSWLWRMFVQGKCNFYYTFELLTGSVSTHMRCTHTNTHTHTYAYKLEMQQNGDKRPRSLSFSVCAVFISIVLIVLNTVCVFAWLL